MRLRELAAAALLLIGAAPADDAFDRTADALARGLAAEARHDRGGLRAAAVALAAGGASPVGGGEDLSRRWLHAAHARSGPATRDRALGPGYRMLALDGGGSAAFEQVFLAGQSARVAVVPRGRADFTMSVKGDGRETVCDASPPEGRCGWVPAYTTRYRIEVRNPGRSAGLYYLMVQ